MRGGELAFALSLVLPGALGFLIGRWWFLLAIVGTSAACLKETIA